MNIQNDKKISGVDCRGCRHLQITWDSSHPRGCRAMGFKTKHWPWMEVLRTSGESCMMFEKRAELKQSQRKQKEETPLPPGRFSKRV